MWQGKELWAFFLDVWQIKELAQSVAGAEGWQEGERAEARSSHRVIARKEYDINTYFYRKNRSPRHARVSRACVAEKERVTGAPFELGDQRGQKTRTGVRRKAMPLCWRAPGRAGLMRVQNPPNGANLPVLVTGCSSSSPGLERRSGDSPWPDRTERAARRWLMPERSLRSG